MCCLLSLVCLLFVVLLFIVFFLCWFLFVREGINRACIRCLAACRLQKLTSSDQPLRSIHSKARAPLKRQDRGDGHTEPSLGTQFSHLWAPSLSHNNSLSLQSQPNVISSTFYQQRFIIGRPMKSKNARTKLSSPFLQPPVHGPRSHPRLRDKLLQQPVGYADDLCSLDMFALLKLCTAALVIVWVCLLVDEDFFTVRDRFVRKSASFACKLCLVPRYCTKKIRPYVRRENRKIDR